MEKLNQEIINHWKQLRGMTYDFIEKIENEKLKLKLPFEKSQSVESQLYCMLGTEETFLKYIDTGIWDEWECSLESDNSDKKENYREAMEKADVKLIGLLSNIDLLKEMEEGTPLSRYLILIEHESHHQGQIINFMFAHDLIIPESWTEKWNIRN